MMEILYADDDVVAVSKPPGLAVHRGWDRSRDVALTRVRDAVGRHVWPAHRLDRPASGVLLFAVEREAARALYQMFADGAVQKRYLALVRGCAPEEGIIEHPLRRTRDGPRLDASTAYRRVALVERPDLPRAYSLVEARPRTGRLHQIRRHFQHISHPLIGDVRYGKGEHNRLFRERFGLQRLFLHACELGFRHPRTGEPVVVRAPLADDLRCVLEALGLSLADLPL
ncbi:MAG: pseudouridylate synthase [Proteobacteria bacterium]|nr:pseudouridylate synthase [Pseudomonadota bacterium]